jgi:hypothetical protein
MKPLYRWYLWRNTSISKWERSEFMQPVISITWKLFISRSITLFIFYLKFYKYLKFILQLSIPSANIFFSFIMHIHFGASPPSVHIIINVMHLVQCNYSCLCHYNTILMLLHTCCVVCIQIELSACLNTMFFISFWNLLNNDYMFQPFWAIFKLYKYMLSELKAILQYLWNTEKMLPYKKTLHKLSIQTTTNTII